MTKELFDKFFIVGNIIKMNHTVVCSIGSMYGKVQLYPTESNIFFEYDNKYIGIYDNKHQGLIDVYNSFPEFFKYTLIKPLDLYECIEKIYNKKYK
jgi:hypothetical protein